MAANGKAAQTLEAHHAGQDGQTRNGGDIVRVKIRVEVRAQGKQKQTGSDPSEAEFPERRNEERQSEVQRCDPEEAVEARPKGEPREISADCILVFPVNRQLSLVIQLLLGRQLAMRNRIGL